jgi:hypothetical protein
MERDRWTLTVTFDSIADEIKAGFYEGGIGEAAEFYQYIRRYWDAGESAYLDEDTSLVGETVQATCGMLDPFIEPLQWLLMHSVPKSVLLERDGGRDS